VLNRPSTTDLDDALPEWDSYATDPAVVFVGGPVAPSAVIALARAPMSSNAPEGWVHIFDDAGLGDLGAIDVGRDPSDVAADLRALRVFVGYAGWAPGQLEAEIEQGAWFVVDAHAADAFVTEPGALWRDVLRRQRGRIAMFAHCPDDPSAN
jgi:putative transcriptional regulator